MKTLGLFIIFFLSFNTQATASSAGELENIFDEYVYSLTVEWDQKDKDFYNKINDDLYRNIEVLIQKNKMEIKDILIFAESKSVNPLMLMALKTLLRNPDTGRMIEFLQENSKNLYSKGTSWNGTVNTVGGIVIISTIITILVAYGDNDVEKECVEYISNPNCDWTQAPNPQQSNAWQCNSGCARWE